jgi:hypothetical protein
VAKRKVIFELLLDLPDLVHDAAGVAGEAMSVRGGLEALAGAGEQLRAQLRGEIVELETDGAGRDIHLLCGQSDARSIHDGEKEFELPKVHGGSLRSRLLERDRLILLNESPRGTLKKKSRKWALSTAVSAADS